MIVEPTIFLCQVFSSKDEESTRNAERNKTNGWSLSEGVYTDSVLRYCLEFSSGMISVNPAGLVVQLLSRTPPDKSVIKAIYVGELNTHAAHSLRLIPVIV